MIVEAFRVHPNCSALTRDTPAQQQAGMPGLALHCDWKHGPVIVLVMDQCTCYWHCRSRLAVSRYLRQR